VRPHHQQVPSQKRAAKEDSALTVGTIKITEEEEEEREVLTE
jgi:hypothetical protein